MQEADIKTLLDARISRERAKELLIELVKVPSPQTELLEEEPLLKAFIRTAIEPRLRTMGFADITYDAMGNLIATYGAGTSGKSLMFIGNAMNQPASTMPNPYAGDVVDGRELAPVLHGMGRVRKTTDVIDGERLLAELRMAGRARLSP
jgi:acetylornithine deacetylase/succinyl-diaminopimelate desuccinylase-like protein